MISASLLSCLICKDQTGLYFFDGSVLKSDCPRCGSFEVNTEYGWTHREKPGEVARLSGWVREQNNGGIRYPNITYDISRRVTQMRLPGLQERAFSALKVIARKFPDLNIYRDFKDFTEDLELQGRSYSRNSDDADVLLHILKDSGNLRRLPDEERATGLSVKGLLTVEASEGARLDSTQGFVAMSFDPSLQDVWLNGFDPAIRAAGFNPLRIDYKEYIGGISDEIIAEIRRSRFAVVDYTGQKNGVYFEAGFALGLGLPVIPTCHVSDVSKLHFDIKHLNTLLWEDAADLLTKLTGRISAVIPNGLTVQ